MQVTHEFMVNLTKDMRQTVLDNKVLFHAGEMSRKSLVFCALFNKDQGFHNNRSNYAFVVLSGGFTEEYVDLDNKTYERSFNVTPCSQGFIQIANAKARAGLEISSIKKMHRVDVFDWHRIKEVQPNTWLAVLVDNKRLPYWLRKNGDDFEIHKTAWAY